VTVYPDRRFVEDRVVLTAIYQREFDGRKVAWSLELASLELVTSQFLETSFLLEIGFPRV